MKRVSFCNNVNLFENTRITSKLNKRDSFWVKLRLSGLVLLAGLLSLCAFSQTPNQPHDGKLLRGEKWQQFSYPEKADFYVSLKGDDSWSGTLPEPNADKTDGPFLTIERAQKAVREFL